MARVLVVYGTTDGHTRKIAMKIAETACRRGHNAGVADAATGPTPATYDAVVVAAPLRRERQLPQVARFVRDNRAALGEMPTAFCSISLTAALPTRRARRRRGRAPTPSSATRGGGQTRSSWPPVRCRTASTASSRG